MEFARRVEEACLNAWPAPRSIWLDGWQLRFAGGDSRRINSVNVLAASNRALDAMIDACEAAYARAGQDTIFRITPFAPRDLSARLDARGYEPAEDETMVLARTGDGTLPDCGDVMIASAPDKIWLDAHATVTGRSGAAQDGHRAAYAMLAIPAAFARATDVSGQPVAVGFAALHDGIACLNNIATAPDARRAGHGARVSAALVAWGASQGAEAAALQVMAANIPALALYRSLGFGKDLYRYHYRRLIRR